MLFEKLKQDRITAMKEKDEVKKNLLSTLIGEASRQVKDPNDTSVIATIKKFINNGKETIKLTKDNSEPLPDSVTYALETIEKEIVILEAYLPKQLTEDGIRTGVKAAITLGANNIGAIMKYFKENYEGRYDGKVVNTIATAVLKGE